MYELYLQSDRVRVGLLPAFLFPCSLSSPSSLSLSYLCLVVARLRGVARGGVALLLLRIGFGEGDDADASFECKCHGWKVRAHCPTGGGEGGRRSDQPCEGHARVPTPRGGAIRTTLGWREVSSSARGVIRMRIYKRARAQSLRVASRHRAPAVHLYFRSPLFLPNKLCPPTLGRLQH